MCDLWPVVQWQSPAAKRHNVNRIQTIPAAASPKSSQSIVCSKCGNCYRCGCICDHNHQTISSTSLVAASICLTMAPFELPPLFDNCRRWLQSTSASPPLVTIAHSHQRNQMATECHSITFRAISSLATVAAALMITLCPLPAIIIFLLLHSSAKKSLHLYHILFLTLMLFNSTTANPTTPFHSSLRIFHKRSEGFANLHRHHHQHHPHSQQQQQQQQKSSYVHHSYQLSHLEQQPNDLRPTWGPSTTNVPLAEVRRTDSSHSSTYLGSQQLARPYFDSSYRHSYRGGHHLHYRSLQKCPERSLPKAEEELDVASKAYLAPIVFYGQLISLAEDYGGRIGATFRLLKLIKPDRIHHLHNNNNNNSVVNSFINADYETHIKLYFVKNRSESLEPPFCAQHMPDISEKLLTKGRYILFAHDVMITSPVLMDKQTHSSSSSSAPILARSVSSTPHRTNLVRHHYPPGSAHKSYRRLGHQVLSLVTYFIPEVHNRNTSRLVRKVLCRGCGKFSLS